MFLGWHLDLLMFDGRQVRGIVARKLAPAGLRSRPIFGAASRPSGTVRRSDKLPRHRGWGGRVSGYAPRVSPIIRAASRAGGKPNTRA
ncbi:hypothetical protein EJA72_16975 [Pseudomonas sp. PB120]|nr:hypothetical protein [Pseudomonas sp. PB120]